MASPPPKPKKQPEDLAEVERALSVLQGRHPEHERMRREDEEKRAKRAADHEAVAKKERRRVQSRRVLTFGGVGAGVVVAVIGALVFRSELARLGRLEQASDPYRAMGFTLVDTSSRGEPSKLDATVSAGCLLAVSTASSAKVKMTHPGGSVEGPGSLVTCLCEGGKVVVSAEGAGAQEGVTLLHAEASAIGGTRAFAFLPFKPGATGVTDQACAEASLDAWLDAKRAASADPAASSAHASSTTSASSATAPTTTTTTTTTAPTTTATLRPHATLDAAAAEKWLSAEPKRAVFRSVGFKPSASVASKAPFVVVDMPASSCMLLLNDAEHVATDKVSVRLKGGTPAVGPAAGNVGWCTANEASVLAQREGEGELTVLIGPGSRIGGLFGLQEIVESAGLSLAASTLPSSDRGWCAKQLLIASAIPETLLTVAIAPDLGNDPDARIVAISVERPNAFLPETPPDVYSFCAPPLDKSKASLCVFSGTQKWRVDGAETIGGVARAKLPFWLFGLQGVNEPAALKAQTSLITLARKLRREGFEPTTLDAVTELDKGAEVLGRANEDAMVVVGLATTDPWVLPYTDGPAWTIDGGEPRIVAIKPLERITVNSTAKMLPPKNTRRTLVFRRQKR